MSQHPYGQDQLPAEPYPAQQPAHAPYPQQPQKTNTMAILGLVFAFVFTPLGLVFSAIGLSQIKKRREGGRGLALAGLILSIVFIVIGIAIFALAFAAVQEASETAAQSDAVVETPAEELELPADTGAGAVTPGTDAQGVVAACQVILPALVDMDSGMMAATTPEEFAQVVATTRTAIEGAAAGTSDPAFVQSVQQLSDGLQLTADAVSAGEDPSYLEGALTEGGMLVGQDCAANGYVE
ncbi:DUF4190 domain-containing protein [Blastococcus deserti]|uniref:DUF4190 domain-containing protein n=1 Tax=Blastococcus deserti TaxID=2259033 RepID=A0ABW4XDU5_9ACTN